MNPALDRPAPLVAAPAGSSIDALSVSPSAAVAVPPNVVDPTDWKRAVEPYIGVDKQRAWFQVVTAFGLLGLSFWSIYTALSWSIWLALALVFPAAGLLIRCFILMHDCAHGSLFDSRRCNDWVGYVGGVLTLTPFDQWRRDHALHHASSGDLDRRGHGDVPTLTVAEYQAKTPGEQRKYRFIRNPLTLLFLGPIHLMFGQRFRSRSKATKDKQISAIWKTNVGIVAGATAAIWAIGWQAFAVVYVLPIYFAAMGGIWLFYVQHQFEEAYWEEHHDWDYVTASLRGSSHLKLSPVLQWFTGSIGLHHIHHLAPKIPNYRLQRCHDDNPVFQSAPVVTWRSGFAALRLALWDERQGRMVRFDEVR